MSKEEKNVPVNDDGENGDATEDYALSDEQVQKKVEELSEKFGGDINKALVSLANLEYALGKQGHKIGDLQKRLDEKPSVEGKEEKKEDDVPFFESLSDEEQESIKAYMKKQVDGLSEEEQANLEASMDEDSFNKLAKEIYNKIKRPPYFKEVFKTSVAPVEEEGNSDLAELRNLFGLVDSEVNALPLGGGNSQGGKGLKKGEPESKEARKDMSNGILGMVGKGGDVRV